MVKLVKDKLQDSSIEQYKMKNELYWLKEFSAETRIKRLLKIMEMILPLMSMFKKNDLYLFTNDLNFKNAKRMGNVLTAARFVTRNYKMPIYLSLVLIFKLVFIT
jgi:hypothetical protein